MIDKKANIIAQLQKEILPLQGFRPAAAAAAVDMGWGEIDDAFPTKTFPVGAVHEFLCSHQEDAAASSGFMAAMLAALMRNKGTAIWISTSRMLFPPALVNFGIEPHRIIFIDLQREKDMAWAMEEALKCGALAAVVGEIREISFTASRRLQLAVEKSQVTGFHFRRNPANLHTSACLSRWKITPLPSLVEDDLPGIGYPRWNVELLKVRNGRPGTWQLEWAEGGFRHIPRLTAIIHDLQKKTG
jgi:protein ImuA